MRPELLGDYRSWHTLKNLVHEDVVVLAVAAADCCCCFEAGCVVRVGPSLQSTTEVAARRRSKLIRRTTNRPRNGGWTLCLWKTEAKFGLLEVADDDVAGEFRW